MASTDDYGQGVNIASLTDAPDAETLAKNIANALAPRSVMRFASASTRAATLADAHAPVPGMITYLGAEERWEGRQGSSWVQMTPGPWIPLSFASGYVAYSGSPAYRLWGDVVQLRGAITRSSGHLVKGTVTLFATLPSGYRPSTTQHLPAAVGSTVAPGGRLDVLTNGQMSYLIGTSATNDVDVFSFSGQSFSIT
ncbi:hypothetical protein [Streptomyces sp. NPDC085937]|uniref:hypothetical protein n=1 Tax=Streptomyces sp. NPDC085937 TaxID=3365742 RepID=UPI0037CFBB39